MSFCLVRPGGLHAVYIRSALPAVQVYEQTVTGLGLSQTQSAGSRRGRERRYSVLKQIECEWVYEWVILHPLASTSTGEDHSLSPVKRAKVGFISAVELHALHTDSLCKWPTNSLSDNKSFNLVIPLLNRKQNLNLFAKMSYWNAESKYIV